MSVIIPCYNQPQFLLDAVDSALASTVPDLEVIVVDDGSTDPETRAVIAGLARPRTTVIRQPNTGPGLARNAALRVARGRYVLPLDADDLIEPTFIERTRPALDADPTLGWVYTHVRFFGDRNFVCRMAPYNFYTLLWENICCATALVRRSAIEQVGGYTAVGGYEDWELWINLAKHGWHGRLLPEVLFYYRRHGITELVRSEQRHRNLTARIWRIHADIYGDPAGLRAIRRRWCTHPLATDLALRAKRTVRSRGFPQRLRALLAAVRDVTPFARKVAPRDA